MVHLKECKKNSILVADDERSVTSLLNNLLNESYDVTIVNDPFDAKALLETNVYNCFFTVS